MKVLICNKYAPQNLAGGIDSSTTYLVKALNSVGIETTFNPNEDYDIVDINYFMNYAKKVLKQAKKKGKPIVTHGHSTLADFKHSFRAWRLVSFVLMNRICYWLYKRSDRIIAVSDFAKSILEPEMVYKKIPVDVVPNALDVDEFKYNKDDYKAFEQHFNIKKGEKVVINAGLYLERKGIEDFMEVARQFPNVKFIWFGYMDKFHTQDKILRTIKHRPKNVIMAGYMRNNIFMGALHRANCIFYPSFVETDGMVMLEAFASKTPLLVRDISAFNYLQDNVHCYKGYTNEDFCKKLDYILNNDNSKVIENGFKYVKENRDFKIIGEKLKVIYEKVLKENERAK